MQIHTTDLKFSHWKEAPTFPHLLSLRGEKNLHRAEGFVELILQNTFEQPLYTHQREAVLRVIFEGEVRGNWATLLNIVTGGGKTRIMAVLVAYFWQVYEIHKFLILTPNTTVRERVKDDFDIHSRDYAYHQIPELFFGEHMHTPERMQCRVLRERGDAASIKDANIIVSNIHQLYEGKEALDILLAENLTPDLVIINDEAHNAAADQYREVLKLLRTKTHARIDLTATPYRLDKQDLDTPQVYEYGIQEATRDRVVKHVLVTKPDIEKVKLTYEEWDEENKVVRVLSAEEMDWQRIEQELKNAGAVKFVTAEGALRQQLKIAMSCLDYQRKGVVLTHKGEREYEPLMMIVALSHKDAERIEDILQGKTFGYKREEVLLVHSKQNEYDNKTAFFMGRSTSEGLSREEQILWERAKKVRIVIGVGMLREGWDVKHISVICLFRKFSYTKKGDTIHTVYGPQIIGRGLRKIHRPPEIDYLFVVDHPAFAHDWLWQLLGSEQYSKPINPGDEIDGALVDEMRQQTMMETIEQAIPEADKIRSEDDIEALIRALPDIPNIVPIVAWQEHFRALHWGKQIAHAEQKITNIKTKKVGSETTAHTLPDDLINTPETLNESMVTTALTHEEKCEKLIRDLERLPERALYSVYHSSSTEDVTLVTQALKWVLKEVFEIDGLGNLLGAPEEKVNKLHFGLSMLVEEFMKPEIIIGITNRNV